MTLLSSVVFQNLIPQSGGEGSQNLTFGGVLISGSYVAEDGTTFYVAENGTDNYVTET